MQLLRNGLGFAAMLGVYGAAVVLVNQAVAAFDVQGIHRLTVPFAADALCGVIGYFVYSGDGRIRTWLVFFSVIAFGALMVLLYDPGLTFYPLLMSLPFAAVAAVATGATDRLVVRKRNRHVGA